MPDAAQAIAQLGQINSLQDLNNLVAQTSAAAPPNTTGLLWSGDLRVNAAGDVVRTEAVADIIAGHNSSIATVQTTQRGLLLAHPDFRNGDSHLLSGRVFQVDWK